MNLTIENIAPILPKTLPDYDGWWCGTDDMDINFYRNEAADTFVIVAYPVRGGRTDTTRICARWVAAGADKDNLRDPEVWARSI